MDLLDDIELLASGRISNAELISALSALSAKLSRSNVTPWLIVDSSATTKEQQAHLDRCERLFVRLAQRLYLAGAVSELRGHEDGVYNVASDFEGCSHVATQMLECFTVLLGKVSVNVPKQCVEVNRKIVQALVLRSLLLCAEHMMDDNALWVCSDSHKTAQGCLAAILIATRCSNTTQLLCGRSEQPENKANDEDGNEESGGSKPKKTTKEIPKPFISVHFKSPLFGSLLAEIRPKLAKERWKKNPSMKNVFAWALIQVKSPYLSEFLDQVLSPCLLFTDDCQKDNKLLGVGCLQHIISNTSSTELQWYGRAEVIYAALEHLLYTHDASVLQALLPCLQSILAVIEVAPTNIKSPRTNMSKYDIVFQHILSDMEMESNIYVRRAYAEALPLYVKVMGITTVRHLRRLFNVIFLYLEQSDGQHEAARLSTLKTLKLLLETSSPRISDYCEGITKALIKLLFDLSAYDGLIPPEVIEQLITEVRSCLLLLHRMCGDKTTTMFKAIKQSIPNELCSQVIEKILTDDPQA